MQRIRISGFLYFFRANINYWPFLYPEVIGCKKGSIFMSTKENLIIKFDFYSEQTVGKATKIIGLTKARYLIPIIDGLNLEANPRSAKTGAVTDAIQESIERDVENFPFKTKGILLASSQYERLERGRIRMMPQNAEIEGILDGGHNTLAIGLYILEKALALQGIKLVKGEKTWDQFKKYWEKYRHYVTEYLEEAKKNPEMKEIDFYVPIELLVPQDADDPVCVESFKNDLLEICAARNNNVQLQVAAKVYQWGYFNDLIELMERRNPGVNHKIEWKTNDGGKIRAQDIIALSWIPLNLITPVRDEHDRIVESVQPQNIYSGKGGCLKQFEKLMSSPQVTRENDGGYKRILHNKEVYSALEITAELPALYDYIYEMFPKLYNAAGGSYGRITAVKALTEKRKVKVTPFGGRPVETISPDGYIVPFVYGLQELMENRLVGDHHEICWKQNPMMFLHEHLEKIVKNYIGIFNLCDYDPQKIGKNAQSYLQNLSAFKMALAGIL